MIALSVAAVTLAVVVPAWLAWGSSRAFRVPAALRHRPAFRRLALPPGVDDEEVVA